MRMTAVIDPTGTLALDLEGETTTVPYASVLDARRSVMNTATELAAETSTATDLRIQDPSGTRTILVHGDGTLIEEPPSCASTTPAALEQADTASDADPEVGPAAPADVPAVAPVSAPGFATGVVDPIRLLAGRRPDRKATVAPATNPFITAPDIEPEDDPIDEDPILGHRDSVRGPRNIQQALAHEPPAEKEETPTAPAPLVAVTSTTLWLVGASGGVGTSTLAGLCSENIMDESEQPPIWAGRALLVCSTSASSLEAAQQLARTSAFGQLPYELVGLVIVHDRPKNRITKPTRDFARGVARMFPIAMTAPYEPSWREVGTTPHASGTRLKSVLRKIEKIARSGH